MGCFEDSMTAPGGDRKASEGDEKGAPGGLAKDECPRQSEAQTEG